MGRINQAIKNAVMGFFEYRIDYHRTKGLYEEIVERKPYWEQVELSAEQIREIESVYGQGFDVRWHRFYQYFTGNFDARYLPEPVYSPEMERKFNPKHIAMEMEDKIWIPLVYGNIPGVYIPKTVVSNASGIYYDGTGMVLNKETADQRVREYLQLHGEAVIKPIRDSYGGAGVMLLTKEAFTEIPQERDFIIQERIMNQEDIRVLNPGSLNTMRVITYICDHQYWTAPIAMRMGTTASLTDNISAGGICIGVKDDGSLCPNAFAEYTGAKYPEHPVSGIRFDGYRLANMEKVIRGAIECHKRTPHIVMASWDMTLNHRGEAVLIEVNLTSQSVCFPQYTHGKALFGANTEKMLEYLKK